MIENMLILAATMIPRNDLLEKIKESATEALLFPDNEEKFIEVCMNANMLIINSMTNGTVEGAMDLHKKMESMKSHESIFNPAKN